MAIFKIFIILYLLLLYISKKDISENIDYKNKFVKKLGSNKTKNIHNIFKKKTDVSICERRERETKSSLSNTDPLPNPLLNPLLEPIFLHLCAIKSPTKSAFISGKGNYCHELEKCEDVKKENTIFCINEKDILINNFLVYSFNVSSDMYYKIKFDIYDSYKIKNSKLIITDEKNNNFIYESSDNINNFILDNNKFNINGKINVCIIFYNSISDKISNSTDIVINSPSVKDRLLCNSINFEVIECNYKKSNNSIIIFKTDEKAYPIYSDTLNILDNSIFC